MKSKIKSGLIVDILYWIAGCAIYSVAVTMIIEPNEISPGGFTGIATILNYLTGIPSGTVLFLLNIPLLVVEYKKFGSGFIIKTAAATFILSVTLDIAQAVLPTYKLEGVLASVFGGILTGFGLSLVLLRGATTGGVDVLAKIINSKYRHFPVGRLIMIMDFTVILFTALVYRNIQSALYSIITIYASSKIIDSILYGADRGKLLYIITSKCKEVSIELIKRLRRGVTVIKAVGGYTGNEKNVLMCAVRIHEVAGLHKIVREIDDTAFIIATDAGEIIGEGFKKYEKY